MSNTKATLAKPVKRRLSRWNYLCILTDAGEVIKVKRLIDWLNAKPFKNFCLMDKPKIGVTVLTSFLAVDYSYGRAPKPIAFETMIFGGKRNNETYRYSTLQEAKDGHKRVLRSFCK